MGEQEPPKSVSTRAQQVQGILNRREFVHSIIQKCDEEQIWDNIKARDVDPEVLDYVRQQLIDGWDFTAIRRQLGIRRSTDKSWTKIMSALKQGYRVDGTAYLIHIGGKYKQLADKMYTQITEAIENGIEVMDKTGTIRKLKGPSQELAGYIDAYNRLNQGFIKNGKDLGAFVDNDGKGPAGGVTIIVQSNVPMPSQEQIEAHQKKTIEVKAEVNAREPERQA